ncbi:MAG: PBP1A family penicillin-binding protein [Pseudomonadota bacterium]|nr:PBP1A family penicillin-binding protein [Pseudomonadota bacterium]
MPELDKIAPPIRKISITLLDTRGEKFAMYGDIYGDPLEFSEVPKHLVQAIIATEDKRFFEHSGFDVKALFRALITNVRAGEIKQGGSTLTQQLAKNIFLKPDRTLRRKVQELLLALWLEAKFSKEQIFTLYINRVYLGSGTYGVDAASRRYFGKSARKINLHEAAVIAGLLKAPSRYSPLRSMEAAETRARVVLSAMVKSNFINVETADYLAKSSLRLSKSRGQSQESLYFSDWVLRRLEGFVGTITTDLVVYTTMDLPMQRIAQTRVRAALDRYGSARGIGQAALVAMTPNGEVRALIGGYNYLKSQFNRAFQALRQPGSAFKLFVYLAALEKGMTPGQSMIDRPFSVGKWSPRNYGGKYEGKVTLRESIERSINTVAVQITEKVGRNKVIEMARRLGITSYMKSHPSLALGASEVSLLELTAAYSVLANGGYSVWPHAINEIRNRDGDILYHRMASESVVLVKPDVVQSADDLLHSVVLRGTGKAADPGWRVAGKTGTSQQFRDAWFVGYSDELVTGVWMGNDDGSPMKGVTGGGHPARLWRKFTQLVTPRPAIN